MGKHPQFGTGTATTRLRRFATDALGGPKFVEISFFIHVESVRFCGYFRRGFAQRVELYYFTQEFLGVVEIPTYHEDTTIKRGATGLWHSLKAKYF